VKLFFLNPA